MLKKKSSLIFLLGFLILLLELALLRYLAGSIWNLSYFPNIVLMAVFFGMGFGFILHDLLSEKLSRILFLVAPYALLGLCLVVRFARPVIPGFEWWGGDIGGEVYFTDTPMKTLDAGLYLFEPFAI